MFPFPLSLSLSLSVSLSLTHRHTRTDSVIKMTKKRVIIRKKLEILRKNIHSELKPLTSAKKFVWQSSKLAPFVRWDGCVMVCSPSSYYLPHTSTPRSLDTRKTKKSAENSHGFVITNVLSTPGLFKKKIPPTHPPTHARTHTNVRTKI